LLGGATQLADQIACNGDAIAKLAPAVPQSSCIIVSSLDSGCHIWGLGHGRPGSDVNAVSIYALGPGILRIDVGPFQPYAVIKREDLHIVEGFLGFGAKITAGCEPPKVYEAWLLGGQKIEPTELKNLSGTRHQSAARFAYAQEDAVALVISQDRRLSVVHRCAPDSVLAVRDVELRL
jgi:hypothetical protein